MNRPVVLQNILIESGISATPEQQAALLEALEKNALIVITAEQLLTAVRLIRSRRESLRISQIKIGDLIGVTDTTIRSYEANLYQKTSVEDVAKILAYLENVEHDRMINLATIN